jgi:hypothetical protein
MIGKLSVSQLYAYALAEEEGVGTAYEYLVKRLVLAPWLGLHAEPARILIAGVPERYGSSLDFALMAYEFGAKLTVVDERDQALDKFGRSLARAQHEGLLANLSWQARAVQDLASLEGEYDLALSSEVLQRLTGTARQQYIDSLKRSASRAALFCPNGDNRAHTDLSGLDGLTLESLKELTGQWAASSDFIDMPPFPPGLTRSDEQREQAATGGLEAMAMAGLGIYARLERYFPRRVRRKQAHIVFALSERS